MKSESLGAWKDIRAGDETAIADLQKSLDPSSPASVKVLACANLWLGRTTQAIRLLKNEEETDFEASVLLGAAMWCEGRYEEVLQYWTSRMMKHDSSSLPARRLSLIMPAGAMLRNDQESRIRATTVLARSIAGDLERDRFAALADIALASWWKPDLGRFALPKRELKLLSWLTTFYGACNKLVGNFIPSIDLPSLREAELKDSMREVVSAVQSSALSITEFVSRVSWAELFLARQSLSGGAVIPNTPVRASPVREMLGRGYKSEGLAIADANFRVSQEVGDTRILGFTNLLLENYSTASEICLHAIKNQRWTSEVYFEIAGIAKWCMGKPTVAVEHWKAGMKAQYGDAAGAARVRLLLFAASILRPDVMSQSQARRLLEKKRNHRRINNWPGPLVRLCLGEQGIDVGCETESAINKCREWEIAFYESLTRFRDRNIDSNELRATFHQLIDLTAKPQTLQPSLGELFDTCEFYLARHESAGCPRCCG
jgi:hypothetical protein